MFFIKEGNFYICPQVECKWRGHERDIVDHEIMHKTNGDCIHTYIPIATAPEEYVTFGVADSHENGKTHVCTKCWSCK